MPFNMMGQIVGSAVSAAANAANVAQINETNKQIAQETNEANRQMVEMQNKAAAAESEKAYQRSKATTQVSNMMQAGMSRAGAINALNGGGSYTPAPVNTSQDSAPQMQTTDFGALANIGQAFAQRAQQKHEEKMQEKQLKLEREKLQFEKDKWNEEKPTRAASLVSLGLNNDILKIEKEVSESTKDGRINAENAENISRQAEAILNDMRSKRVTDAMSRMTDEELDDLFELQATLNMLQQGLQYDSTAALFKAVKKLGTFVGKGSTIGRNIRTH